MDGETTVKGKTVTLAAEHTLSMKGCATVKIDGASAKITAQILEAKGDASVKLESGGILTVKGAMTKIN